MPILTNHGLAFLKTKLLKKNYNNFKARFQPYYAKYYALLVAFFYLAKTHKNHNNV